MNLTLADLGDSRAIALFQIRAAQQNNSTGPRSRLHGSLTAASAPNFLSRSWAKETGLGEEAGLSAIKKTRGQLLGIMGGFGGGWGLGFGMPALMLATQAHGPAGYVPAALMGAMSLTGLVVAALVPRNMVRRWGTTPLSSQEIDVLLNAEEDSLERSYLLLVREALAQENLPEAAQQELKSAIKILGQALDRLPSAPAETAHRDTLSLRTEAVGLRGQALQEPDRVAADSLERRAAALERSAAAMEKSATLLRRNSLLRQELKAQLEALRLELGSTVATGTDPTSLAQVAHAAQGVAREADALASARAELDTPPLQRVGIG
jgi:hypothetical protein